MFNKIEHKKYYSISLLLSTKKRKNFESLGLESGISGDKIAQLVTDNAITANDLIALAQRMFGRKKVYLLIDDTLILKTYSRVIEGTSDNYSSSEKRMYRSFCSVVAMLTDGITAIPIDQQIWTSKEFTSSEYKRKWELAQDLILYLKQKIDIKCVILDGLYAVDEFIKWLNEQEVFFEMRFHSNRVISKNGVKAQIKKHSALRLMRGRSRRTIKAFWKETPLYFTALKRQLANGYFTTVFQVSNFKANSSEHVKLYGYRWNIEKFFRTAKQYLGLNDCQSRKIERQKGHVLQVFIAYALAQYERVKSKLKNVETAIKSIKLQNSRQSNYAINRLRGIFFNF